MAHLSFDNMPGATTCAIYMSQTAGVIPFAPIFTGPLVNGPQTSYYQSNLTDGATYYYYVTEGNTAGNSNAAGPAAVTPQGPPAALTNLTATAGDGQVTLQWDPSNGATQYNMSHTVPTGGTVTMNPVLAPRTSGVSAGLVNGTAYTFTVTPHNDAGDGPGQSVTATPHAAVPSALTGLRATPGDGQVTFSWDPSNGATQYKVVRTAASGETVTMNPVLAPETSGLSMGLVNGTAYTYAVTPSNDMGDGQGQSVTATPRRPAPTGLTANPGVDQVTLSWTPYPGADQYYIGRSSASGQEVGLAVMDSSNLDSSNHVTYTDTAVVAGEQYFYQVESMISGVQSQRSAEASAIVPLHNTVLTAVGGIRSVSLSWTAVPNALWYDLKRCAYINNAWTAWAAIGDPTNTQFTDPGLVNGAVYCYAVAAFNDITHSLAYVEATATPTSPVAVTSLNGSPNPATTCDLVTFTASATDSAGAANLTYAWTFGDGGSGTGSTATHRYTQASPPGGFTVTVTATDTVTGGWDSQSFQENVTLTPVTVAVSSYPNPATTCDLVTFNAYGTDPCGGSLSYFWTFGDGEFGTGSTVTHRYKVGSPSGGFPVTVTATDSASGQKGNQTLQQRVTLTPVTVTLNSFKNPATTCDTVQFNAYGMDPCGGSLTYAWSFGDGQTGTGSSVSHHYTAASGVDGYPVTVTATDPVSGQTAKATVNETVTVAPVTVTAYSFKNPATTCDTVQFNAYATDPCGGSFTYLWSFGDGATSTLPSPTHQYAAPSPAGGYNVTVAATDPMTGQTGQASVQQTVTLPPLTIPYFNSSPLTATTCDTVQFYASATEGSCNSANLVYTWDFGDGTTGTGNWINHQFIRASGADGYNNVTLTVTDPVTMQSAIQYIHEVVTLPPLTIPYCNSSQSTATTCDTVQFSAYANEGTCGSANLVYTWDFPDGGTATGNWVTHQFTAATPAGGLPVTLTVTDPTTHLSAMTSVQQVVNWPAVTMYNMNANPNPAQVNQPVAFSAYASESCNSNNLVYTWEFDDGSTANGNMVTHTYTAGSSADGYNVKVTATDPVSQQSDTRTLHEVVPAPTVEFDASTLTNGTARACAGAIDDPVHEVTLTAHVKEGGYPAANVPITFSVQNPAGEDYHNAIRPQWKDDSQTPAQFTDQITRTSNANGDISVTIRSSNVMSQPHLVAMSGAQTVGSVRADFAEPIGIRRFPNWSQPDETEDTGWIFDFPNLASPADVTPAKIYLKFMKDPLQGNVDGNWSFVNGHVLTMQVDSVVLQDGTVLSGPPENLQDYGIILASAQATPPPGSITFSKMTSNDGSAQAFVRAGAKINDLRELHVGVVDMTVPQ